MPKKTYGSSELVLKLTNFEKGKAAITSGSRPLLCVPTASPRATNSYSERPNLPKNFYNQIS